jgi:hypothetical protein
MSFFKVGGLNFIKLHRLQLSWCITRPKYVAKPNGLPIFKSRKQK